MLDTDTRRRIDAARDILVARTGEKRLRDKERRPPGRGETAMLTGNGDAGTVIARKRQ